MKPGSIKTGKTTLVVLFFGAIAFALISWGRQQKPGNSGKIQQVQDTIPEKKDRKIRDLDEAISELERVDINEHVEKALKEPSAALKQIDAEKMKLDVEKSLKEVDFDKIKMEVDKAMKEIDAAKIERQVKESIAKIDFEKMKAEFEKVKEIDLAKVDAELAKARKEMEKAGPEIEKELKKARVEIEKAKAEMKEYKRFVDGLSNDGLINKKTGYTISHEDEKLTINGKQASASTYNKYKTFLEKHKKFRIKKDLDDFDLDTD
jgi:hypothetical protein